MAKITWRCILGSLLASPGLFWSLPLRADPVTQDPKLTELKSSELFNLTNVWVVHLRFTPEQWKAMEPKGEPGGFFGGGPGGGRGGRGGGGGGFGPAMFVAPAFLKDGDSDQDGKLSRAEFGALAQKWFKDWDKGTEGELTADQLRAGLNATLTPPEFGRPPGGGPGRRGPGPNLQGAEGKRNGLASAMGIEFNYVHADLEIGGLEYKDVGVRYKGNGTFMQSRGSLKRSLKVDLDKFAKGRKLSGVNTLNFHNNVTDASWMNEVLSHRLFRAAGVPGPRTAYARIYVTVPGEHDRKYLGLYSLVEDIDKNFAEEQIGSRKGAILKPVTSALFTDLGEDWKRYNQIYDPKTTLSRAQQQRIIDFCKLVSHSSDAQFAELIGGYLDLDQFARFMSVQVWLATLDSILTLGQNFYVYLAPKSGKFQFLPWDLDHSFGQFPMMGNQEDREQLSIQHPWQGENRFLERVFSVPEFKKLYLAKLEEFSGTIFQPEIFQRQVDEIAAAIRPAVQDESAESLARFDKVVAGEPVAPAGFGRGFGGRGRGNESAESTPPRPANGGDEPRFAGPPGSFQPVKPIKGFVQARAESVRAQLAGTSEGKMLQFGFGGGRGGPGGGRGGPGGGRGGPGGFGPGNFLGDAFMSALDQDKNSRLTEEEFKAGFANWFESWDSDRAGTLTDEQLRAGINKLMPPFGGRGGGGFGPPGGSGPRPRE